jgi:hypothetical protein
VNYKQRGALLVILIAALCGLGIWGAARLRYRGLASTSDWLDHLPTQDAVVFYVDLSALRKAGILNLLAGSPAGEEPEYKIFVFKTEFDYTRDLDAVAACFAPRGKYFIAKGRFDWNSLQSYTREQGGNCRNVLCRMDGSTPERRISFFPLRPDLMGLAVSPDNSAAVELEDPVQRRRHLAVPDAPVWISVPPAWLKTAGDLPEGTRMFARSMEDAEDVNLALAPKAARFEARLSVQCRSEQQAAALASQLDHITGMLREMIARDKQTPNPRDLSGVLTVGSFTHSGTRAIGVWPIERSFIQGLLAGSG